LAAFVGFDAVKSLVLRELTERSYLGFAISAPCAKKLKKDFVI
jgi:hypothetical protein